MSTPEVSTPTTRTPAPADRPALGFAEATLLVARREIVQRGREKSFVIGLAITLAIVLAVIILNSLDDGASHYDVGVVAGSGVSGPTLEQQAHQLGATVRVRQTDGATARREVKSGSLDAAFTGPGTVLVARKLGDDLRVLLEQADRQDAGARALTARGIDPAQVQQAYTVAPLRVTSLDPPDRNADERKRIAALGTFLLYGQLIGYAMWVALGIVEEKSSRVVEVLLATVPARALLAGKVLGIGLLGLGQLLLVAAVGLVAAFATGAIHGTSNAVLPVSVLMAWFVLGYAFYSTLYAAAAARVSRQEDLQNVTTPMTLVVVGSLFAALWAGSHGDSRIAQVLGVVPPFSALVNPTRVSAGDAAGWETPLAVLLMLAAIGALVVVGARLYEGALLHSGSVLSWRAAWGRR